MDGGSYKTFMMDGVIYEILKIKPSNKHKYSPPYMKIKITFLFYFYDLYFFPKCPITLFALHMSYLSYRKLILLLIAFYMVNIYFINCKQNRKMHRNILIAKCI